MGERFEQMLIQQGISIEETIERLQAFSIETPLWGYGNSGTRFKVFPWPGAARNLREKLEDAAQVQRVTGCCPAIALHIPWDQVDNWVETKAYTEHLGLRLGAVNPNLFQEAAYRFGSLCHNDKSIRAQAVEHVLECIKIAQTINSDVISLWLADG